MIYYKTEEEIELIRESSLLVAKTLGELAGHLKPGISTAKLDKIAEEFIKDNGAVPAFKGYNKFPNTLCTSINYEVVHGIPSEQTILKEGDIISIDCGVLKNNYYGDSAYTFQVGEISEKIARLLKVTKESLYIGIEKAIIGNRVGDISYSIQQHCEGNGYSVVRDLIGHGIGRDLHEKPEVPNYGKKGTGNKLQTGMVIAIEPMINMGVKEVKCKKDGWTVETVDKMPSAHFEHTVAIGKDKADILSSFDFIEEKLTVTI